MKSNITFLLCSSSLLLFSSTTSNAACNHIEGVQYQADGGSDCQVTTTYLPLYNNSTGADALMVQGGASLNITSGGIGPVTVEVGVGGNRHGVSVGFRHGGGPGTLYIDGDLITEANGTAGRGIYTSAASSSISVTGNVTALRTGTVAGGGAGIEISPNTSFTVGGDTRIDSVVNGLRAYGTQNFNGNLDVNLGIDQEGDYYAVRNRGTTNVKGALLISSQDQGLHVASGSFVAETTAIINAKTEAIRVDDGQFSIGGATLSNPAGQIGAAIGSLATVTSSEADAVLLNSTKDMYLTVYGNITGKTAAIRTNSSGGSKIYAQFYNGSTVNSVDGVAFVDEAGDANLFLSEQANLVGSILLGDGSDQLTLAGTDIAALTILDGGDDVSAADGFIDTLTFTEGAFEVNGANLLNWEQVIVRNGTVSFLDSALTTGSEADIGLIAQNGGTILAGPAFTLDGNLDLRSGGSFVTQGNGSGSYMINYDLINAGHLNLSDENEGDLIEVAGNYVGSNGLITLDTRLHDDNSATDMISIAGNTSGNSDIKVYNTVGTGSLTTEGIKIVEVGGTSAGIFNLQGDYIHDGEQAVVGGAYAYKLYQGGASTPTDGHWYLRSQLKPVDTPDPTDPDDPEVPVVPTPPTDPLYQAGVPTYESYAQSLLGLNGVSSLQQRVGNRFWVGNGNRVIAQGADVIEMPYAPPQEAGALVNGNGVWGRIEGAHNKVEPRVSTSDTDYNQNVFKLQAGVDGMLHENENGTLIGGVFVQYVHGKTKTKSVHGDGEISTDGYGFGGTLTWYGHEGFYVDAQAQATWYDSDLSSRIANLGFTSGNDGFGYALSLESGKRFAIDPQWSVTPQAQLVYSHVDFDSFTDVFGAAVSLDRGESLQGRLGITLDHENSWQNAMGMTDRAHVYGIANLYYEFLSGTRVDVAGTSFASEKDRLWGGIGLGGSYNWNDDKYSIYGEGIINTSLNNFGDSYTLQGNIGFRVKW